MASTMIPPVSHARLREIATEACNSTLGSAHEYEHSKTESWNTNIINTILRSLIAESSSGSQSPSYKYAVNSTIIQHLSSSRKQPTGASTSTSTQVGANEASARDDTHPVAGGVGDERPSVSSSANAPSVGRRGMHSATGAYWNNEKDGMWSFKYETGEEKGMDVVISVIWIYIG
ncbi:hypothetical protein L228DRAFT_280863 [Xylona heveae TC161]|uniref:Tctex-1 n=1 Tax=Xylona heveae (strain CBS 132557 / TC161) TaxID=1328760 RepID=A0A161THC0_XYLHT|nr:hypothetical protein L228DRAFT_280863 [Xylona heveae TC161]KZF25637.1 hypothetical protein L228DRAFT_280863 [Xylona heveae TC161]